MAFDEVVVSRRSAAKARIGAVAIGLSRRGATPASAVITIGSDAWMALGMPDAVEFALLIGRGPDQGRIRLQSRKHGSVVVTAQKVRSGGKFYRLSLGHRPEFPDRLERTVPVEWAIIDDKTFEIELPAHWAAPTAEVGKKKSSVAVADITPGPVQKDVKAATSSQFRIALERFEHETVLAALVAGRGKFLSERALQLELASIGNSPDRNVAQIIKQIREKLPATVWIRFVSGSGYMMQGDVGAILVAGKAEVGK